MQLVTDDITLLYPNARGVTELKGYDPAAVRERYGIEPEQYPDIAALVGETSDNLIGIDKVGEKTAVKWITQYGGLDELLAHADEITGVVGQNLRDQQDRAVRNRKLNRLVTDVELEYGPADLDAPADGRGGRARAVRPPAVPHPDRPDRQDAGSGAGRQPRRRPRRSVWMPACRRCRS